LTWWPDGRDLLADRRWFRMYRLKACWVIFDIEAEFTASTGRWSSDKQRNAPLIQSGRIDDGWSNSSRCPTDDGGKAAFGAGGGADCSGPLVRRAGKEQVCRIVLDHPSNRNHRNAWFARLIRAAGTNLAVFDGPLTPSARVLDWHRITRHEGTRGQRRSARFDEYAQASADHLIGEA
jgi:hypothetical protein